MQPNAKELVDLNQNGIVDEEDVKNYERICEVDAKLIRDKTQIALAWVAMISMVVVTLLLFLPLVLLFYLRICLCSFLFDFCVSV